MSCVHVYASAGTEAHPNGLTASREDRKEGPYFYAHYDLTVPWSPSVIAVNISSYCKVLGIEI